MTIKYQLIDIVKDFFKAFDEKDLKRINNLCVPTTKIIHHNGVTTNTKEMCEIIKTTKNWWPRIRRMSDFEYFYNKNLAVLGFKNQVIFSLPKNKKVKEMYRETWIFKKNRQIWKPIRIHYSSILQCKHSEEVT